MDELEFLRLGIGTLNFVLSDVHVYTRRYSYQKNATSICSKIEKPDNTLQILVKSLSDLVIDNK